MPGQKSHAYDYPQVARKAIREMYDQVGDLKVDKAGIACSGLIVLHLVMPGNLGGTYNILKFLKEKISSRTHVNLMSQYHPMGDAGKIKEISSPLTSEEFRKAHHMAKKFNLEIIQWVQKATRQGDPRVVITLTSFNFSRHGVIAPKFDAW